MSTKAKHTPTPWKICKKVDVVVESEDGITCFCTDGLGFGVAAANAEFIVLACNAHEDVVKALEAFFEWYDKPSGGGDLDMAAELLRAALAKARGDQ